MTATHTSFEVLEAPQPDPKTAVLAGLERGRIPRIDVDVGHDRAVGFATWDDPLDVEFSADKVFFGSLALFCFRIDRIVIPSSTLKLYVRQRIKRNLDATHREKMPRSERDELTEAVRMELLRKSVPTISAYQVMWDMGAGRMWLNSSAAAVCDEFVTRCRLMLGLVIRPMNIVGVMDRGLTKTELEAAYRLLPASFLAVSNEDE